MISLLSSRGFANFLAATLAAAFARQMATADESEPRISRDARFVSKFLKNNLPPCELAAAMPKMPSTMGHEQHREPLAADQLVRNTGQACSKCFALLFRRYCRQVFAVSFRILRDKAETEDIVQEVFVAIYLQQARFDAARGTVRTWILQFAYFKALLRRRYLNIRCCLRGMAGAAFAAVCETYK